MIVNSQQQKVVTRQASRNLPMSRLYEAYINYGAHVVRSLFFQMGGEWRPITLESAIFLNKFLMTYMLIPLQILPAFPSTVVEMHPL